VLNSSAGWCTFLSERKGGVFPANFILPGTTRWSDYDDDVIYGDYVVDEDTSEITNTTAYLPGIAHMDTQTGEVMYLHSDQIGSLRAVSTEYGEPIQHIVYTSFGEKVYEDSTIGTRYQYAGAWGYQSSEDLPFVHVGHRYYDPSTGRFLQRDPIGIQGGLNAYGYVENSPTTFVDPTGYDRWLAGGTGRFDHLILTVGCVQHGYVTIEFYSKDWLSNASVWSGFKALFVDDGAVLITFPNGPPRRNIVDMKNTTWEQDQAVLRWITKQSASPPDYSGIGYNCRHFARRGFNGGSSSSGNYNGPFNMGPICFVAGTPVATENGPKYIEDIIPGDIVYTRDFEKNVIICADVVAAGVTGVRHNLIDVEVDGEIMRSTATHPYWTANRGWVRAADIEVDDLLVNINGDIVPVDCVQARRLEQPVPVYDIRVREHHSFFAGENCYLVHNS